MLDLAIGGYNESEVKNVLNMSKGSREVAFSYALLDKNDIFMGWIDQIEGSISHDSTAEIKGTAKFKIAQKLAKEIDLSNDKIQPFYRLKMSNGWVEWPQGIYLLSSPTRTDKSVGNTMLDIDAYDKAQILLEDKFTSRYFISSGTNYVSAITTIINSAGLANVNITANNLVLPAASEFEIGYSKLAAVNDLLKAINYNSLTFNEQGFAVSAPYIEPIERAIEYDYQTNKDSVIKAGANQKLDIFNAPNVFVRYTSSPNSILRSEYINDNPTSKLSTVQRGRSVVDVQSVDNIADQATLDAYTRREAIKAMQIYGTFNFSTAIMPHHTNLDCLRVKHGRLDTDNLFIEQSWSMNLQSGADMVHVLKGVIEL